MHTTRRNRKANALARKMKSIFCAQRHADAVPGYKRAAILKRYPHPPRYGDPKPMQPACYSFTLT